MGRRLQFSLETLFVMAAILGLPTAWTNAQSAEPAEASVAKTADGKPVSAAALVQAVYDSFAWVEKVHTLRIRTDYKITNTPDGLDRSGKAAGRAPSIGYGGPVDTRPFCVSEEWAWNDSCIRKQSRSHYEGETKTTLWDGKMWVESGGSADQEDAQYVLATNLTFCSTIKASPIWRTCPGGHAVHITSGGSPAT